MITGPESPDVDFLAQKQHMIRRWKENLAKDHARMKKFADLKRSEREFQVVDMVYLKL
jgi:hypothetical protein